MNREERAAIWRDELAHPCSPTTIEAMRASGADMRLVADWQDLEGDREPGSNWMVYADYLEGAIGIAADYGFDELDPPTSWSRFHNHLKDLWDELAKITDEYYDENGSSRAERIRYAQSRAAADEQYVDEQRSRKLEAWTMSSNQLRALAQVRERQDIAYKERQRLLQEAQSKEPSALTESIIDLPGELYVRYNPETKTFLGFGFTPINDSHPGFTHVDGPEPGCDLTDYDNPVWNGMREYLSNVQQISGEAAFAVQWTEDGWRVK